MKSCSVLSSALRNVESQNDRGNGESTGGNLLMLGRRTVKRLRPTKALIVRDSWTVSEACKKMASCHLDAVLLTDSDSVLCGIFTDKDLVTRVVAKGLKPEETCVASVMTRNPVYVGNNTSADLAVRKMIQGKFRHIPVVEDGQVIALVNMKKCLYDAIVSLEWEMAAISQDVQKLTASTSIEALRGQTFQPTIGSLIMQSLNVVAIDPTETVYSATKRMVESGTDYVIITNGATETPQGIFTSKDLLMRVVARSLPVSSTTVDKVMSRHVECAELDTTIVDALHIMHDGRFCHLPIVNPEKHLIGCIGILELMEGGFVTAEEEAQRQTSNSVTTADEAHANLASEIIAAEALKNVYPSLWLSNFFSFKVKDPNGCIHRFNCGTNSLEELVSVIAHRVGKEYASLQLLYKDEDGDLILLSSDSDLALAVSFARAFGMKVLRLYVDYTSSCEKFQQRRMKSHCWSFQTTVLASILVIVGLGILFHARTSSKEPWKVVWNRLLTLKKKYR